MGNATVRLVVKCFSSAILITLLVALGWGQQTPQGSGLTLRSTTRGVVLDVVVTDKAGQPVHDLTKSDFTIYEDDTPQEIASFETAGVHLHPLSEAEQSQTVLILDEMNTRFEDLAFARYAVAKLLQRNSGKLDMPMALMALTNSGMVPLHGYTRDGNEILRALDSHRAEIPWRLRMGFAGERERLATSIGAIREIAFSRADYHARKNIVWISPGFPILTSADLSTDDREVLFDALRNLSDELLRTRITMYTADPRGVTVGELAARADVSSYLRRPTAGATALVADLALERLALETGGKALHGRNDLDGEIQESMVDGATYFTLSYYPSNRNWDGAFRKIRVEVGKLGLQARTRDGYFGLLEPPTAGKDEAALELTSAVSSRLSFGAIPVKVVPAQFPPAATSAQISLDVDAQALSWTASANGDYHCAVEVVTANLSDKGSRLDYQLQSLGGSIATARFENSKSRSWVIPLVIPVKAQASRIRVVIRDKSSGRLGTVDLLRTDTSALSLH